MSEEVEKQEGQKTVVAFIAGLLIGGLLVWVFSAPPENPAENTTGTPNDTAEETDSENGTNQTDTTSNQTNSESGDSETGAENTETEPVGDGELSVNDQAAGSVVILDSVTYPTNDGWVVVRDYIDETPGSILGASRYELKVGLEPSSVNLLRATEPGQTYQVVFYSENGDRVFDLNDDTEIEGFSTTFTAE